MSVPSAAWTWVCGTASDRVAGVDRPDGSARAVAGPGRDGGRLPAVWLALWLTVALVHLLAGWWFVRQAPADPEPAPAAPAAMNVQLLPVAMNEVRAPPMPAPPAAQPRQPRADPVAPVETGPGPTARTVETDVAEPVPTVPAEGGPAPSPEVAAPPVRVVLPDAVPPTVNPAWGTRPPTVYPVVSRRLGEQGDVVLGLHVQADGRIAEVEVRSSSGHPRLDRAAIDAARRWRLLPARRDGQPVALWHEWVVAFRLH